MSPVVINTELINVRRAVPGDLIKVAGIRFGVTKWGGTYEWVIISPLSKAEEFLAKQTFRQYDSLTLPTTKYGFLKATTLRPNGFYWVYHEAIDKFLDSIDDV